MLEQIIRNALLEALTLGIVADRIDNKEDPTVYNKMEDLVKITVLQVEHYITATK